MPIASPAHDPNSFAYGQRLAGMASGTPGWAMAPANAPYMNPTPFGTPPAMGAPTAPLMPGAPPPAAPPPQQAAMPPTTNATGGPMAATSPQSSIYTQMYRMGKRMDGPGGAALMDRFAPQAAPPVDPFALLGQPPVETPPVSPMANVPPLPPAPVAPDPRMMGRQPQQQQGHPMLGGRGSQLMDRLHNRQPLAGGRQQRSPMGY